ncbi:MAG TPA: phosphonate metabolism transcriptional regulator PhnF [Paracoccus sp.]|nr:phosphonate metabolism transcriptional regulator PhnF [Paracoccus sp. (in: a-proteobacteria)]
MTRPALWHAIADTLRRELAESLYSPGERLPSEAALAARFGVNRHTVREALADLAAGGLVQPRRGAGVFVTARPTEYPLGRQVRFSQSMLASGRTPTRELLRLETRRPTAREGEALEHTGAVHVYEGVSLADRVPVGLFRSAFPAAPLPGLPEALRRHGSVTAALAACGVADYTRARTRLTAESADTLTAGHLRIAPGAAVLRAEAVNVDPAGRPVEYGVTWFAGARVALTVEGG